MSGKGARKICQVNGCSNSQFKLQQWKNELCPNQGFFRKDCSCCIQPYQLHQFPQAHRQEWVKNLSTKLTINDLKDYHRVCSVHFVDGKPSKGHPYPTLHIGYSLHSNWKLSPGRRAPRQRTRVQTKMDTNVDVYNKLPPDERMDVEIVQPMDVNVEPKYKDVSTQYYSAQPLNHDHCYAKKSQDKCTQTPSAPSIDTNDMNDKQFKFFTGLSSTTFWALLSSFMCWTTELPSHSLPVAEQFLMVLMRLRLGLLLPDLGYRFKISTRSFVTMKARLHMVLYPT
ncbi:uncharacterized protein LOC117106198 [Anneissia japonica]|uniref:uncharacterized protein LOC117106198 n=1 Tax=Anneissia japonica TaxID=1529436 RepID=UPI0014259CB3|nr:uncharacterized protein LOC117106198 [Anneissia japonica]